MASLFSVYENDFSSLIAVAGEKIARIPSETAEARKATSAKAQKDLSEAEELVQQMELEARSADAAERSRLQTRLKSYKNDVSRLKKELRTSLSLAPPRRGGSDAEGSDPEQALGSADAQRAGLLAGRLQEGSRVLRQAQQTVAETEQIGANILGDLRSQRETIMHATGKTCSQTLDYCSRPSFPPSLSLLRLHLPLHIHLPVAISAAFGLSP